MGGGASDATKKQQQLELQQTQMQMAFNQQLMDLFQKQFANQQNQLNFLKGVMEPVIKSAEEGKGFSDEELTAMRTSATDTLSGAFKNAEAALGEKLKTSGSADVPSGVAVGADTALLSEEARAQAGTQNQITIANAEQARSNLFNAANVLQGVAAQNNPNPLASEVTAGSGAIAGLGQSQGALQRAITEANSNSFFGRLAGSFASSFGSGLGTAFGTGTAGMLGF